MKKLLLSLGIVGLAFVSKSQIIFQVQQPAPIADFYDFEAMPNTGWGIPGLTGQSVVAPVKLADDGTNGVNAQGNPASASGCNDLTAGSLTGKIALVFRGDGTNGPLAGGCEFGTKAKNCHDAGAVGVIVVNRDATIIPPGGGAEGPTVTIPVIMVNMEVGQMIMNTIDGDNVVAFIGDKTGMFDNDLSVFDNTSLRANFGAFPLALAQDNTELSIPLETKVYNFGNEDQAGVTVTATVTHGTEVYNEVVALPDPIEANDSAIVTFPNFELPSYTTGEYIIKYEVNLSVADDADVDNVVTSNFFLTDSTFSFARLENGGVAKDGFYRSNPMPETDEFQSCITFSNANASRLRTNGVWYGGITVGGADTNTIHIEDQLIEAYVFEWNDTWTTTTDATFDALVDVTSGSVDFFPGMEEETVFIEFDDIYQFEDDQNYLVCIVSYVPEIYHAMDTKSIYDYNAATTAVPRFPIKTGITPADWNPLGFGMSGSIVLNVGGEDLSVIENSLEAIAR